MMKNKKSVSVVLTKGKVKGGCFAFQDHILASKPEYLGGTNPFYPY